MKSSPLKSSLSYDVLVVGAGVAGLGAAAAFAKRGLLVAVLSRENLKGEASPRAAGILDPLLEQGRTSRLIPAAMEAFKRFPKFLREIERSVGFDAGYQKTGMLYVAVTSSEKSKLFDCYKWQKKWMPSLIWMKGEEVLKRFPQVSPKALGGLYYPEVGKIHAARFMKVYRHYVKALRVRFFKTRKGFEILKSGTSFETIIAGRKIYAERVVNAAGAWSSGQPLMGRKIRVTPARGQILTLKGRKNLPVILHSLSGGYLVPWGNGVHLAGSTVEFSGFRGQLTVSGRKEILRKVTSVCPAVSGMKVTGGWAGLRPYSENKLPVLGPVPGQPGYYAATGYFRSGILLGAFLGEQLAQLVLTGKCLTMIKPLLMPHSKGGAS
jgi:glycine oxidase